jgi:hypothetical protein
VILPWKSSIAERHFQYGAELLLNKSGTNTKISTSDQYAIGGTKKDIPVRRECKRKEERIK